MTRARDVANVLSTATALATDTETAALIATEVSNRNAAIAATPVRGNTASRPASPTVGDLYANTQTGNLETYTSLGWSQIGVLPAAPTSLVATNSPSGRAYNNGSASVAFSAGTGGLPSSYTITSSPGSYTATGSTSPITVTGLQSSTQYTYTGTASNNYGTSSASSASTGVTATTVPQAPTISSVTGGNAQAEIAITANATGGSSVTGFTVTSSPGNITASGSSPVTVTGLTNGTAYTFTAVATNANGNSLASSASSSVTPSAWEPIGAYDSIATSNLATSTASVTFSSIPSTYTHLQIRWIAKCTNSGQSPENMGFRFNSDTGTNYTRHYIDTNGSTVTAGNNTGLSQAYSVLAQTSSTYPSAFSTGYMDILDYSNVNKYTTTRALAGIEYNGSGSNIHYTSDLWLNTAAITNINIRPLSGNFAQYSSFALYGIKGN